MFSYDFRMILKIFHMFLYGNFLRLTFADSSSFLKFGGLRASFLQTGF